MFLGGGAVNIVSMIISIVFFVSQSLMCMDSADDISCQLAVFNPTQRVSNFLKSVPNASLKSICNRLSVLTPTEQRKVFVTVNGQQKELLEMASCIGHHDAGTALISSLLEMGFDDAKKYYAHEPFCKVLQAKAEMESFRLHLPMKSGQILKLKVPHYIRLPKDGAEMLANVLEKQEIHCDEINFVAESFEQICAAENQQDSSVSAITNADFFVNVSLVPSSLNRLSNVAVDLIPKLIYDPQLYTPLMISGNFLLSEVIKIGQFPQSNKLLPLLFALSQAVYAGQDICSLAGFLVMMGANVEEIAGILATLYLVSMTTRTDKVYVD